MLNSPPRNLFPVPQPLAGMAWRVGALMPNEEPVVTMRLTFYLAGLLCFGGLRLIEHYVLTRSNPRLELAQPILLGAGMLFFFLACRSIVLHIRLPLLSYSRALLTVGLVAALVLACSGLIYLAHIPGGLAVPYHYKNDAIAMSDCGTRLFLDGHNPYTDFYLVDCLPQHGLTGVATTPLEAGAFAHHSNYPTAQELIRDFQQARRHHVHWPAAFEAHFSYPAGTFLFALPNMALGWHELSVFNLLWLLLSYLLLAWWAPPRMRLWLVPLALGNITIWANVAGISSDSLDVLLILAGWATWQRSWLSAVLMGAAIATRQNAWFFVPFYAILISRTYGWRALAHRSVVMAAVFALINGPFFLQSPAAWIDGVLGPLRDPMFPSGYGVITFAQQGWLPLWSHQTYTVLELAALAACALVYARICRQQPGTGLVLALVPIFLAWRSSPSYFVPLPLLCLWPLLDDLRRAEPGRYHAPIAIEQAGVTGRHRRCPTAMCAVATRPATLDMMTIKQEARVVNWLV